MSLSGLADKIRQVVGGMYRGEGKKHAVNCWVVGSNNCADLKVCAKQLPSSRCAIIFVMQSHWKFQLCMPLQCTKEARLLYTKVYLSYGEFT